MDKLKAVWIWPKTKTRLEKLAQKHTLSQVETIDQMTIFFEKTGFDPQNTEMDSPVMEVKKLRNTIVSFIRKQEKEMLAPLVSKVDVMVSQLAKVTAPFPTQHSFVEQEESKVEIKPVVSN